MRTLSLALAVISLCVAAVCSDLNQTILAAQDAIAAGNLDAAAAIISAALQHRPDGGLYNLDGIVHAQRGELAAAHHDFAEAVRLSPRLTPAWRNLARVCQLEGETRTAAASCAISSMRQVLALEPNDTAALSSLTLLYEQHGRFAESLAEAAQLPGAQASEPVNLLVRCADLAALRKTAEAMQLAIRLNTDGQLSPELFASVAPGFKTPQQAPTVIALLEPLDARHAADLESLRSLAVAYEQVSRPKDARKTLERVAIMDPHNPAHLLELARLAENEEDHEGALGYLAHARDLEPANAQVHFLFARVAAEMELPVEAKASLERALALDPKNATYNFAMGTVILTTRDAASAAAYFKKFISIRPADPIGHYALGVADFASGDYANAKREIQQIAADSKLAGAADYFLGRMALLDDDLPGASLYLKKSIALLPQYGESHTEMARVYMRQEKPEEARTELHRALELDPRSFQANMQLLILYKRSHDPHADEQSQVLKHLDADRSRRAELMLRTIVLRP